MAEAAVSFLLEELKDVQKWFKDVLSGSEDEFQKLKDDLNTLRAAFIRGAANKPKKDEIYREMERQIREVVYIVEDTIEACLVKQKNTSTEVRLADEVKSLRENRVKPVLQKALDALSSAHDAAMAADLPISRHRVRRDNTQRRDKVVGFEDEEAKLMGYLTQETKELDVISIIGMPGLGKTTLAFKIFGNDEICFQFPIRIWVYVTQRFNCRDVFLNILRTFSSNDMSGLSDEELAESVRAYLAKEKFLLVMDDVWSADDWKVINNALPKNNGSSKVMITSRYKSVGVHANISRKPHMLRFLRPDECMILLQLEVYGTVENFPPELLIVGVRIANQCDGVPLAVVVVGGILVNLFMKTRVPSLLRREWEKVSQNISDFIQNDPEARISNILKLSYNGLPEHLRECYLYMAVFPEDHVIPVWKLTRLWIAEGFVRPRGKSLEEAAEENLSDLVSNNLLIIDTMNAMGEIKTCRVHDMVRAFCRDLALEENLFQEIRKNKMGILEPPVSEVPKFHRLCFQSDLTKFFLEKPKGPCTRSFLCFYDEPVKLDARYVSTFLNAFEKLRVLEYINIIFPQFPPKLTRLIHLRYVTLNIDALPLLPETLSQLWNLQTLLVKTKSSSIKMKANIWKMYRLRHLKMKAAIILDDNWDGEGGGNIQTLSRLAPESCTAKLCEKACNLKELGIRGKLATLFTTMSMENLYRLERLKLINDLYEHRPSGLPQPKCFPPNLQRLTLSNTFLDWEHASTLAMIRTLEVLKLKNNAFTGDLWNAANDVFESLQVLLIVDADLVDWVASGDNFPFLTCLVLKNCDKLENIPGGVGRNLETLDIECLGKSAVGSARSIEAERRAVQEQHISRWEVRFKLRIGPGCEK